MQGAVHLFIKYVLIQRKGKVLMHLCDSHPNVHWLDRVQRDPDNDPFSVIPNSVTFASFLEADRINFSISLHRGPLLAVEGLLNCCGFCYAACLTPRVRSEPWTEWNWFFPPELPLSYFSVGLDCVQVVHLPSVIQSLNTACTLTVLPLADRWTIIWERADLNSTL